MKYDHKKIERHWQKKWEEQGIFHAKDNDKKRQKFYALIEFPYPSGEGLHVGHPRPYIALDIVSRKKRMQGYNVLFPIGWDAFGLPTENYAIKTGVHPSQATKKNIARFRNQIKSLGISFDWNREINTTDPAYYKWTQWIFLKFFEHGLAYKKKQPINWCLSCKTGLANEEVVGGKCERCGGNIEKREKDQWMLAITKYADKLLEGLDKVDYLERIKEQQINWIGKSEGLEEEWPVEGMDLKLKTFTTSPHTTWGATFMAIAPEHSIISELVKGTKYEKGADKFIKKIVKDKMKNPKNTEKKKQGFFIGRYAINHLTGRKMPLYIANFAIYEYGTGIVKCTPAHDQRDFDFAKKYDLDIVPVIIPDGKGPLSSKIMVEAYTGEGTMMNAGKFNGLDTVEARKAIGDYTAQQGHGQWATNYKLRDWVFSRQRYWGEPIPMVYCQNCAKDKVNPGWVALPEDQLPLELPVIKKYQPTDTGESPLASVENWVNTSCPKCGGPAKRETDTMPNWAGSSWYFLRYCDSENNKEFASKDLLKYWVPVDWYNGGMEHTTLHLLYSRFWYKFLCDIGEIPKECGNEPYKKRTSHGMILGKGGEKMSKSRGNVVNPDDVVGEYGADAMRLYEMFMGPFDQAIVWSDEAVGGMRRFLERIWNLQNKVVDKKGNNKLVHKIIKKVTNDIEGLKFNTAIAALMTLVNELTKLAEVPIDSYQALLKLLHPFAPHITEELNKDKVLLAQSAWPKWDEKLAQDDKIELVIQINGKVRDKIEVDSGIEEKETKELALASEKIQKWINNQKIKQVVFVKGRLINIVL